VDRFSIVNEELNRLHVRKKLAKNRLMIACPFHDDKTPSCGILIAEDTKYQIGSFHCLGCGAHGNWNKLATKLGLRTIGNDVPTTGAAHTGGLRTKLKELDNQMMGFGSSDVDEFMKELGGTSYTRWPETIEWRGYPGWLLSNLGSLIASTHHNELFSFFPVIVGEEVAGMVRARVTPVEGKQNYLTTEGEWIKAKGLFPFDFVRAMLKHMKVRYVVYVEGPRDALRLIMNGIPALAVLGSQNVTSAKLNLLMRLGIEFLIGLPDNDKAGRNMLKTMEELHGREVRGFDYVPVKLPRPRDEKGELIKIDPGNMDNDLLEALFEVIEDNGGSRLKRKVLKTIKM
jgi:hypothetical protein